MDTTPTIRPSGSFNPERVAAKLQKAIKGMGTDERTIIEVLTSHTNSQRQEIKSRYKTMYGRDLEEDLRKELSGTFKEVCMALLIPQYDYLADCLHLALQSDPDIDCIIDTLTTYNNWDIKEIKDKFAEKYNDDLENLVCQKFSGEFQRVLRSLVNGNREENTDPDLAEIEAKILYESGVKMWGTDEDQFLRIFCSRSFDQLRQTFNNYANLSGHSMETAIDKEFSGELAKVFGAIVSCAESFASYYAKRLHSCIAGIGTDDKTLIRILITRSEIDLEDIKDVYKKMYNSTLSDDIASDVSGDYKKLLIRILSPL